MMSSGDIFSVISYDKWEQLYEGKEVQVTLTLVPAETRPRKKGLWNSDYDEDDKECSVIFKVGNRYFEKVGDQDSFDDIRLWYGPVLDIIPETKTITTFKRTE